MGSASCHTLPIGTVPAELLWPRNLECFNTSSKASARRPHLSWDEHSVGRPRAGGHPLPVALGQLRRLCDRLPHAVAMQRHLCIGCAAEVRDLDPHSWGDPAGWQDVDDPLHSSTATNWGAPCAFG